MSSVRLDQAGKTLTISYREFFEIHFSKQPIYEQMQQLPPVGWTGVLD